MACPVGGAFGGRGADSNLKTAQDHDSAVNYGSYLRVPELLSLQVPESGKDGSKPAHDELLFIVIHQVYELWFKLILHEIDSIRELFSEPFIPQRFMLRISQRLERVIEIFKVLVSQMSILETMTPLGFMEFRDHLSSASGFQSMQFRLLENKLGVLKENRINYHSENYTAALGDHEAEIVEQAEKEPALAKLIERWLERTPGLQSDEFDFWSLYERAVRGWLADTRKEAEETEDEGQRALMLESLEQQEKVFSSLLDKEEHDQLVRQGARRISHDAMKGAIMIYVCRDEPLFHLPFKLLQQLMDIDTQVAKWRGAHVMLVRRMIGSKLGTGGSSGYLYLRSTTSDRYKVFLDFFNLSTFLIPRDRIPKLPESVLAQFAEH